MSRSSLRGKVFFVVYWVLTRLWWGVEISRLAVLRHRPKTIKKRMTYGHDTLPGSTWLLARNMFYCLSVDDDNTKILVRETPPIELN